MGVLDAVKRLNRDYKDDNLIITADVVPQYKRLATGAFGFDYVLFGGIPEGSIISISGQPFSGKTTGACAFMAAYQKAHPDKVCVYVDCEHRLDLNHQARMNGLDLKKLQYFSPIGMSGEQIIDTIVELQKEDDIGMIILDSVPAMIPQVVLENDLIEDKGMRATMAKKMYPFLAIMASMVKEKGNNLILINQVRDGGKTFTGAQIWKEPCNGAISFYSSVSMRFGTRTYTKGEDMDACKPDGEGSDGFRLKFKITKNSTANPTRGGGFITYRYETGMDKLHDLLEIATTFDFIKKSGAYRTLINLNTGEAYTNEKGEPLKGYMKDITEYIMTHEDFQKEYVEMLTNYIAADNTKDKSFGQLLDAETNRQIASEEASVAASTTDKE